VEPSREIGKACQRVFVIVNWKIMETTK
jgi:hypothetical protein